MRIHHSLSFRLALLVGLILLVTVSTWTLLAIHVIPSLANANNEILDCRNLTIGLANATYLGTATIVGILIFKSGKLPVHKLIIGIRHIGQDQYHHEVDIDQYDQMGHLALAFQQMGK